MLRKIALASLAVVAGLFTPSGGRLSVRGDVSPGAEEAIRRRVALVLQDPDQQVIGATVEEAGFDKRTIPSTIQRQHHAALELMPQLRDAKILEDWAGLRPGTQDGLPILGATGIPGYYAATGHFRDGILLAPITAEVMAQIISDETPAYDLSAFSPLRFL